MTHQQLVNWCVDYINAQSQSMAFQTPSTPINRRPQKQRGISDVHACIRGKFISIEIKIDKDKQSKDQLQFEQQTIAALGEYWLIRYQDDLINKVQNARW